MRILHPNAHFVLGLACMWTHRPRRETGAFEEAIKLNPSFAAAHVVLGQMYLYSGRPEEAIVQAEKGIRLSPQRSAPIALVTCTRRRSLLSGE